MRKLHNSNIRLRVIGDRARFSARLQKKIAEAEALTADNTGLILNVAANYGGRWDIAQAAQRLAQQVADGKLAVADVDEQRLGQALCLADQAPVDLLIRTGGDHRISNSYNFV